MASATNADPDVLKGHDAAPACPLYHVLACRHSREHSGRLVLLYGGRIISRLFDAYSSPNSLSRYIVTVPIMMQQNSLSFVERNGH